MKKKAVTTEEKVIVIPKNVNPIPSRVAASILQCSMGHVRWLRRNGRLKSWKLSGRYTMLDRKEVEALAKAKAKQETRLGAPSKGFQPDT
ncbi:DNA-binding protein [bacterium]|nr:DNA-binding protein [bacterium]